MQNILSKRLKLEEFMKLMEKTRIDTYHFGSIEELNQLPKQLSQQIFQEICIQNYEKLWITIDKVSDPWTLEEFSNIFLQILQTSGTLLPFLEKAIEYEIQSNEPQLLFREDTFVSIFLKIFFKQLSTDYLKLTLSDLLKEIISTSKVVEASNTELFKKLISKFISTLSKSIGDCPPIIRYMLYLINLNHVNKLGNSDKPFVLHLFFFKFICPSLIAPNKFSLFEHELPVHAQKNSLIISKLLNSLSFQSVPPNYDESMVAEFYPPLVSFMNDLISGDFKSLIKTPTETRSLDEITKNHFLHFLEYIFFTYSSVLHNILEESPSALHILLDQTPVSIENLTTREWNLILACATVTTFEKDAVILEQGAMNARLFKIKSGTVRVEMKSIQNGTEVNKVVAHLSANDIFGEMSILGNYGAVSASIVADEFCEIYIVEMSFIYKLFETEPQLGTKFYMSIGQKLSQILISVSSKSSSSPTSAPSNLQANNEQKHDFTSEDSIVSNVFGLSQEEIVVKNYSCAFKQLIRHFGKLLITPHYLCFLAKLFGTAQKKKISISEISTIERNGLEILIIVKKKKQKNYRISFANSAQTKEAFDIISELWQKRSIPDNVETPKRKDTLKQSQEIDKIFEELPRDNWDAILTASKSITLPRNGVILSQGEKYQKMFQINRGTCRIEIEKDGERKVVGYMKSGETFGEISFLQNSGASAFVISDSEDGVDLTVVDGFFINALMSIKPHIGTNFFKYLAILLSFRIRQRRGEQAKQSQ